MQELVQLLQNVKTIHHKSMRRIGPGLNALGTSGNLQPDAGWFKTVASSNLSNLNGLCMHDAICDWSRSGFV